MLRHDYTKYDGGVPDAASDRMCAEILDEIAEDFPWLADQCEEDKRTRFSRLPPRAQARRWAYQDAAERQRVARQAKKLSVGGT